MGGGGAGVSNVYYVSKFKIFFFWVGGGGEGGGGEGVGGLE